jgi:primosomal protein N'
MNNENMKPALEQARDNDEQSTARAVDPLVQCDDCGVMCPLSMCEAVYNEELDFVQYTCHRCIEEWNR